MAVDASVALSPMRSPRHLSDRAHLLIAACVLVTVTALATFVSLGAGNMEVYDEGLYGMYARNALHRNFYLYAIDPSGGFATGALKFSKPPLSIWVVAKSMQLFGPSLFALRAPFALASAGIALLLFAWGRRLAEGARGSWLGFTVALLWLASHGALHWGRTATIEPLLIFFALWALYAWGAAHESQTRTGEIAWALASGVGVAGAFFTKQAVCALAVLPMVAIEIAALRRREPVGRVLLRSFIAMGVPFMLAVAWVVSVYKHVGEAAKTVLLEHALINRVAGYDGLHHKNYLNRVLDGLDKDAVPFSWQLGLVGLALCATAPRQAPASKPWRVLLPGMFAVAWLAFDVGSRSILPWYVLTLVAPLAFGNGWLLLRFWEAAQSRVELSSLGLHALISACAGAVALFAVAVSAAREFASGLMIGGAIAGLIAWWAMAREREDRSVQEGGERARHAGWIVWAATAFTALVLVLGTAAHASYRNNEPDVLSTLGQFVYQQRARRVSLDPRDKTHVYRRVTFLGSTVEHGKAPWLQKDRARAFDGWVDFALVPNELVPRKGVRLMRAGGAYAVVGSLSAAPFARTLAELVDAGRTLTFEAEYMASDRNDTLAHLAGASGGLGRSFSPRHREQVPKFNLARGATLPLPPGNYSVDFYLRVECGGFSRERLGAVRVAAQGRPYERLIECGRLPANGGKFAKLNVQASWSSATPIELSTRYDQGSLTLDRITLKRQSPPRPAAPSRAPKRPGPK